MHIEECRETDEKHPIKNVQICGQFAKNNFERILRYADFDRVKCPL